MSCSRTRPITRRHDNAPALAQANSETVPRPTFTYPHTSILTDNLATEYVPGPMINPYVVDHLVYAYVNGDRRGKGHFILCTPAFWPFPSNFADKRVGHSPIIEHCRHPKCSWTHPHDHKFGGAYSRPSFTIKAHLFINLRELRPQQSPNTSTLVTAYLAIGENIGFLRRVFHTGPTTVNSGIGGIILYPDAETYCSPTHRRFIAYCAYTKDLRAIVYVDDHILNTPAHMYRSPSLHGQPLYYT